MGIERPDGPYAAQMTAGGAWPEADEQTYFRRAEELDAKRNQFTDVLEQWQRQNTQLFDSDVWAGQAAEAAAAHLGRRTAAMHVHERQLAAAIAGANTAGGALYWAKRAIVATVEYAQAEIADYQVNPQMDAAQRAYYIEMTVKIARQENLAAITEAVAKLGPASAPISNIRLVSGGHRLPQAPAPKPADDPLSQPIPQDPKQFHDFWQHLTPAQKDALYGRDHAIGNHPGMPVDPGKELKGDHRGSDWYNRRHLDDELAQARAADARADGLKAAHPDWADGKNIPRPNTPGATFQDRLDYEKWQHQYDTARNDAEHLPDLQAVQRAADQPGRKLLLLDTQSGHQIHAAIAIGNPDTANHISVTTPGLNTTVRCGINNMADEASRLRDEALRQLSVTPGHKYDSVATVAWIGYDTPQVPGLHEVGNSIAGGWDVTHDRMARAGAHDLAGFYDGLQASHEGPPAQVTAIGHSYGSLTTGLALQEPGNHGITDAVFYGSPGIEATTPQDLHLQSGHVFTMEAPDDKIQWAYDGPPLAHRLAPLLPPPFNTVGEGLLGGADASHAGDFGPNPATNPNFTRLSTAPTTVPDGRFLEGASGHSQYPQSGNNGEPRISGYNLAAVLAGLADKAVPGK